MNWKCEKCGKVNDGGFCTGCGTKRAESSVWVCAKCGMSNDGNFCMGCGAEKVGTGNGANGGVKAEAMWTCGMCGSSNRNEFCVVCGARKGATAAENNLHNNVQNDVQRSRAGAQTKKSGSGKVIIWICAVLVAVGAIAVALGFFWDDITEFIEGFTTEATEVTEVTADEKPTRKPSDDGKTDEPEKTPEPTPTATPAQTVSTYEVYKADVTWYEADNSAKKAGAELVSVNDREEFEKVCSLAQSKGIKVFWVGAKRKNGEDWTSTKWHDSTYLTDLEWFPGEPTLVSENGDDENFLMVFNVDGKWYFNDAENDVSAYYAGKIGYITEQKQ